MNHFEYTDPTGDRLVIAPDHGPNGQPVVAFTTIPHTGGGTSVLVPLEHLEEVIAGERDMARQAGGATCGHTCPKPSHTHTCQRSPQHLDIHRDVKQKGNETCNWEQPHEPTVTEALDIIRRWYIDVNDGAGWDASDLIHDLEKSGYPLPDDENDEE
ncbi:hypothetical protein [Streptomyces sp. NPDC090022]|uniref:hypothetical protein n=1 Tax=Streptomyces sp. NPDC090022 TaxID=3365920 RepID=UPI003818182A